MSVTTVASGLRKVVAASMAGTVVEWYEFFLYGTAATLVFNKVFFAKGGTSDLDAILAAFITYAVASPRDRSVELCSAISVTSTAAKKALAVQPGARRCVDIF